MEVKKLCLSTVEAAEMLGISISKLRQLIAQNQSAPPYLRIGRRLLFPLTGLEEWVNKNSQNFEN